MESQAAGNTQSNYIIGIDTGGTFTDVTVLLPDGETVINKAATTPGDFSLGVMNALQVTAESMGMDRATLLRRSSVFKHGTTVATNAMITRTGSKVGLLTTKGHEDAIFIMRAVGRVDGLDGMEIRHVTKVTKPEPLLQRPDVRGIFERLDFRGDVLAPLDEDDAREAIRYLVEERSVDAIAICLLFGWKNPVHEKRIVELIGEMYHNRDLTVTASHAIAPMSGEYARINTTVANSFLDRTMRGYVDELRRRLHSEGLRDGGVMLMQGNGGIVRPEEMTAVGSLQSGPAGGMIATEYIAGRLGHDNVITTDMGGTSFDVGVLTLGALHYARAPIVERARLLQPLIQVELLNLYAENPGIHDGDQFYLNDPYVASTHVYDQMIVKPIFHNKTLVAWTASMTHTADTGGILRGGSTEIFHEGVRTSGIKLVEGGVLRKDIFNILTEQCRDPNYVGLDLKSRIAANNVCARGFLQLVEKYGIDFINAANRKLIADSEAMARARLKSLPDGVWQSQIHAAVTNVRNGDAKPILVVCTMTKRCDTIAFDFGGSSAQNEDAGNLTLVGSWGQLFVALSSQLFWNIPWNGGMARPVTMTIPEGTFLNCRYPAACGDAPALGGSLTAAASECIAKLLYAAGLEDDVNASWYGSGGAGESSNNGGPGFFYGGHNQHGLPVGQGLYDMHGSGFGAAPYRDGVSSGGHMNNPSVGISDIENIELQYPLVYLSRNHLVDSGGFGKFRGGQGLQRIIMVYGTSDLTVNYSPYHGIPGGWGLFGGYPMGVGGHKFVIEPSDLKDKLRKSRFPIAYADVPNWGKITAPKLPPLQRLKIPEYFLIADPVGVGSGYGDPLDRAPDMVVRDIVNSAVSAEWAAKVYGVVVVGSPPRLSEVATQERRTAMRKQRLKDATSVADGSATVRANPDRSGNRLRRIHEYVEIARLGGGRTVMRCCKCAHVFGPATENYKNGAVRRVVELEKWLGVPLPSGVHFLAEFHEYFCPSCATQLAVETHCPSLEDKAEPVWDIRLDMGEANASVAPPEGAAAAHRRCLMTARGSRMNNGALSGLLVLEVASYVSGPFAGMLLSDLGAEVVKIEPPGEGDPFRGWGKVDYSATFGSLNRNKKSVVLDLKAQEGRDTLRRLAMRADVLVENFRPGTMERMQLGYEHLRPLNGRLIYCAISGFGSQGPYRDYPGYDTIGQGMGGLLSLLTERSAPKPMGISLSDHLTGVFACYGILAAIVARQRTGRGQLVETSLIESTVAFLAENAANFFEGGPPPDRARRTHQALVFTFVARDGRPLVIHLSSPQKFWTGLTKAIGRQELQADARFRDRSARSANYDALDALLAEEFRKRDRDDWLTQLRAADVPCGPLSDLEEVFDDPQVKFLGLKKELPHPRRGRVAVVGSPVRLSDTPVEITHAAPDLGEDTDAIIARLSK